MELENESGDGSTTETSSQSATPTKPKLLDAGDWLALIIGPICAGGGWVGDWLSRGSDFRPRLFVLFEKLSGPHGLRDWMMCFALFMWAVPASSIAERSAGVLRRFPQLILAVVTGAFGVYAWNESRWVLLVALAFVLLICGHDSAPQLPRAKVRT